MTTVFLVECCFGAEIEKVIGPYSDESTAHTVADAIETHFYDGGDQYTAVICREVVE